jgi:hypothetical protein
MSVSFKSALSDGIYNINNFYKVIGFYNCTSGNTGDTATYTGFGLAIKYAYISNAVYIIYCDYTDNTGNNAKILRINL